METDAQLFLYLNTLFSGPLSTAFFGVVTGLGNGLVQAALVTPLLFFFKRDIFRQHFVALVLTAAMGGLFVSGVKVAVDRPRPPTHFGNQAVEIHLPGSKPVDRSFPSGHTQTAFSTATYLALLFPILSPLLLLGATLVGLSRVALGVHFPLDVVVGGILGIGFAVAGYRINRTRLRKKETKPS